VTWFIQSDNVFRVALSTLYLAQREGGLGLIDVKAKCLTLLLNRCVHLQREAALTAEWITLWNGQSHLAVLPIDIQYRQASSTCDSSWGQLLHPFSYLFRRWECPAIRTISVSATFWTRFAVDSNHCQMT
jgi:hypothetical protein